MINLIIEDREGHRAPVDRLVVAGDQDSTCKPEASERMHREIAGSRKIVLSPAKHLGLIEHHARYAQALQSFVRPTLNQLDPGALVTR